MADKNNNSRPTAQASKPIKSEKATTSATPARHGSSVAKQTATAKSTKPVAAAGTAKQTVKPASAPSKAATATTVKPAASTVKQTAKPATTSRSAAAAKPATTTSARPAMRTVVGRGALTESVIERSEPQASSKSATGVAQKSKAAAYVEARPIKEKRATTPRDIISKVKNRKSEKASGASGSGAAAKTLDDKKKKIIIISAVALAVIIVAIVLIVVLTRGSGMSGDVFQNKYVTITKVGVSGEYLGTVARDIPTEVKDGGLESGYPKFGYTLGGVLGTTEDKVAARTALIAEANSLCTVNTANAGGGGGYNIIKADGSLYLNDVPALDANGNPRKLYKHSASVGLYLGDVADDEPGIVKKLTFMPRSYTSYYDVTGLYAPAGEVIKVQISEEDMKATGGIVFHIGQALYNGQANNIWTAKNQMNRLPVILNTIVINETTATKGSDGMYTGYIGSYVGGPIYVRGTRTTFSVTISGGVRYSHFILGYTTPEEFAENAKSSAPYFDLEVWDNGVLHSGPAVYAKPFGYDELYDAAVLWDKISLVSTHRSTQGIVFLYDPFVAAGAAVAFPGRRSVNCPMGWMSGSLNYKAFVRGGSWGNMHEYNHNYQGAYGRVGTGADGETTNNALTLVSYSLFTKISSARGIGSYGGAGLSGWNCYTSPSWALAQVNAGNINSTSGLAVYATLLHNFGQDAFMSIGGGGSQYFINWGNTVHYNMSYFLSIIDAMTWGTVPIEPVDTALAEYPMFVPVSSVYQTGRSYMYDGEKRYIATAQPFVIKYGEPYEVDLGKYTAPGNMYESGSIVLPDGFSYTVKNVSAPEHGTLEKKDDFKYTYTPDADGSRSGKMIVTLAITKDDGAFPVEDVDLVLEFEQTHELDKNMLQRTTYKFADGARPESATAAFESNYEGYTEKIESDNVNRTQNCNADIWYTDQEGDELPVNSVVELKGKIHVDESAKYRIALRGRWNCALYISLDGQNYELAATYVQTNSANYAFPNTVGTYKDLNLTADDWVYFKAVLLTDRQGARTSFIGVGWGKFVPPPGVLDENNNLVGGGGDETVSVGYASALRSTYEYPTEEFTSDYFYTRSYSYSYINKQVANKNQTILSSKYTPWNADRDKLENLVDGNLGTYIHTRGGVSEANPFEVVVDMGESKPSNRMVLYSQSRSDLQVARSFTLAGSDNGTDFFMVGEFGDAANNGSTVTVDFDEKSFRYYRLTVSKSSGGYLIITEIELSKTVEIPDGKLISPDDKSLSFKNEWKTSSAQSYFGHVYVGGKGAEAEFEFTGNRFAVMSQSAGFDVYIDGEKQTSISLDGKAKHDPAFISQELAQGKHKVRIVCTASGAQVDSVVYWQNED